MSVNARVNDVQLLI